MRGPDWSDQEDELLRALFPRAPWQTLLAAIPQRTKSAINVRCSTFGNSPRLAAAAPGRAAAHGKNA